jgi:hypothetical protein
MQYYKELEKLFDVEKNIDTVEKTTLAAIEYVPSEIVRDTAITLAKANANFARANLAALKTITLYARDSAEEFSKKLQKAIK